jgi:hypothetical protein
MTAGRIVLDCVTSHGYSSSIATHRRDEMTKQQAISALIANEFKANGGDIVKAFDKIMGEGAYTKLAREVYNGLRNGK